MTRLRMLHYPGHDLPPKWDGHPVRWLAWQKPMWTTLIFHSEDPAERCAACQKVTHKHTAKGITEDGKHLVAERCSCGHDTVFDLHTGELWELEASDYGDAGSYPDTLW